MDFTVEMLFRVTSESVAIILADQNGTEIAHYDGRDSIDPKYNNENDIIVRPSGKNEFYVEIYQDDSKEAAV